MADGQGASLTKIVEGSTEMISRTGPPLLPHRGAPASLTTIGTDGDGMPDTYELANQLNPADPTDAALDADADGESHLDEYLARTNPRAAQDNFRVGLVLNGGAVLVRFTAAAGKTYTVQFKRSVSNPEWTTLAQVPARAETGSTEVSDTSAFTGSYRFYRVVTPQQP